MINFNSVTKYYGQLQVLNDLNFNIDEGEIIGFLGPNGAGKTTTLRTLAGILPPSHGTVTINGKNPLEDPQIRSHIGFLPENNPLYEDMTVEEWLKFWTTIKLTTAEPTQEIMTAVKRSGLTEVYYRQIGELSKGYRQRVGLAQAILGHPDILILDEPTEGLDPNQRQDIHTLIKELGKKRTVIISSHVLSEITKMCSRVMIIHRGSIVADGTPHELTARSSGRQIITAVVAGKNIKPKLQKLPKVIDLTEEADNTPKATRYTITSESNEDLRLRVFNLAKDNDWNLYELNRNEIALEDVFAELTR